MRLHLWPLVVLGLSCSDAAPSAVAVPEAFESDDPAPTRTSHDYGSGPEASRGGFDDPGSVPAPGGPRLVKMEGTRLYAATEASLHVVDLTDPDRPEILARRPLNGVPSALYVRGSVVVVVTRAPNAPAPGESELVTFDASVPSELVETGRRVLPGFVSWLEPMGDTLVAVSAAWGPYSDAGTPFKTYVATYRVAPSGLAPLGELPVEGAFTPAVTGGRLYLFGSSGDAPSRLQLMAVGADGALSLGATVTAQGAVSHPSLLHEEAGILRVISQEAGPFGDRDGPLVIETFATSGPASPERRGVAAMPVAEGQRALSAGFAGTRAYVTLGPPGRLVAVDLTSATAPAFGPSLDMPAPGAVYGLEGDRLVVAGGSTVALYNVDVGAPPRLLSELSVPGEAVSVAAIERSGTTLAVPFASGRLGDGSCAPRGGVQVVDLGRDTLSARGVARPEGAPQRALFVGTRLVTTSDRVVATFDAATQPTPALVGEAALTRPVLATAARGDRVLILGTQGSSLELRTATASAPEATLGRLVIPEPDGRSVCGTLADSIGYRQARLFFVSDAVAVLAAPRMVSFGAPKTFVAAAFDVVDPRAPRLLGRVEVGTGPLGRTDVAGAGLFDSYRATRYYEGGIAAVGDGVVAVGSKVAFLEIVYAREADRERVLPRRTLRVVDFANPLAPVVAPPIELPASLGVTPLVAAGGIVLTSRWSTSDATPGKVRFFVDRIDLRGATPVLLTSLNTPGSLVAVGDIPPRFITADYAVERTPSTGFCFNEGANDFSTKECVKASRIFKLVDVVDGGVTMRDGWTPPFRSVAAVVVGDDRVHLHDAQRGASVSISGLASGRLGVASEVEFAVPPRSASGERVAAWDEQRLRVYDTASNPATPLGERRLPQGADWVAFTWFDAGGGLAALGDRGLEHLP